jgi:Transposase.
MLVIFINCEGIVHQEEVPPGQIINRHYSWEVLQCVMEQVSPKKKKKEKKNQQQQQQPTLLVGLGWLLHHNSVLAHTT